RLQRVEPTHQPVAEKATTPRAFLLLGDGQLRREAEPRDEGDRQRARAQTTLLPSAEHQRMERLRRRRTPRDQGADAFWTLDFVTARADQIDARMAELGQFAAEALCRVDMEHTVGSR